MDGISTVRVYLPKDLRQAEHRQSVYKSIQVRPVVNEQPGRHGPAQRSPVFAWCVCYSDAQEVKRRFPDGVPLLDPVDDMGIEDEAFKKLLEVRRRRRRRRRATSRKAANRCTQPMPRCLVSTALCQKMATLREKLAKNPLAKDPRLDELLALYERKVQLGNEIKALKKAIKQATAITQMEELKARKRVLRRYRTALGGAALDPALLPRAQRLRAVSLAARWQAGLHDRQRCHRAQGPRGMRDLHRR